VGVASYAGVHSFFVLFARWFWKALNGVHDQLASVVLEKISKNWLMDLQNPKYGV